MTGAIAVRSITKRSPWFWGAFLLLVGILLQVLQQAQSLGQVFRGLADLEPASFGRWFEPAYNVLLLALLLGALHDYEGRGGRRTAAFRLVLAWAALIQGFHVIDHAAAAARGGGAFAVITSRGFDASVVHFEMNLLLLAAMVVCFVGLRARAEIPTPEALAAHREVEDHVSRSEAYAALGRSQRVLADMAAAQALLEEAVAHARIARDDVVLAQALKDLGELEHARGRYGDALRRFAEVLSIEDRIWETHGLRVPLADRVVIEDTIARCAVATA